MVKVAINGFGRIGRNVFRRILDKHPELEVVGINDLTDAKTLAYLIRYDSIYGVYNKPVKFTEDSLLVDGVRAGKKVQIFFQTDPERLPWKELEVDIVIECTGRFTDFNGAKKHLLAGAKKVIISAPSKSSEVKTYILGVNEKEYDSNNDDVLSMAS